MELSDLDDLQLTQKTLLKVKWFDITDDTVGDPEKAHLVERTTYALFWKLIEDEDSELACMVLTYMDDSDVPDQQGWLCVPVAVIDEIEVIRRPRKRGKRAAVQTRREHQEASSPDVGGPQSS